MNRLRRQLRRKLRTASGRRQLSLALSIKPGETPRPRRIPVTMDRVTLIMGYQFTTHLHVRFSCDDAQDGDSQYSAYTFQHKFDCADLGNNGNDRIALHVIEFLNRKNLRLVGVSRNAVKGWNDNMGGGSDATRGYLECIARATNDRS